MRNRKSIALRIRRGITLPLVLLFVWEISNRTGLVDARFLPSLENVALTAKREFLNNHLIVDLASSLLRNLGGFLLGAVLGIALATVLALSPLAGRLVMPTFNGFKQISLLAWIPLISVWFGFGEQAKIAFVALASFIPVVLNTYDGMRDAPSDLVEVGHALRFNARQRFLRIYLPAAMPAIATGIHLGLIYSWLATVGAEYFLAVGPGIGGLVIAGRERFDMAMVMVGVIILGLVGFALNRLASGLENYLLRWRPPRTA